MDIFRRKESTQVEQPEQTAAETHCAQVEDPTTGEMITVIADSKEELDAKLDTIGDVDDHA